MRETVLVRYSGHKFQTSKTKCGGGKDKNARINNFRLIIGFVHKPVNEKVTTSVTMNKIDKTDAISSSVDAGHEQGSI